MNKSCYRLLVYLIIINSFISITNKFYPGFLQIGKILGGLLLINIAIIFKETLKIKDIFFCIFLGIFSGLAILHSVEHSITIEHLMFFISTTSLIWKLCESNVRINLKQVLSNKIKLLNRYVFFIVGLLLIGLIMPSCYKYINGDNLYYGFAESGHKLAGNICFVTALTIFIYQKRKFQLYQVCILGILFMILLMTGSRTYCIPEIILLFVYYKFNIGKLRTKWIITPIILVATVYLIINSNVLERFISMGNNTYVSSNFWEAVSSGRLIWWKIDIQEFAKLSIIEQILGKGFTFVYQINEQFYGLKIGAHNDFLNILLSVGWIGLIGYILIILNLFFKFGRQLFFKNDKSIIMKLSLIAVYILWNANINGFYGAQQYLFSFIILILIFDKN